MARIAVVSDTHGDFRHVARVRPKLGEIDWLFHAGDHLRDAARVAALLGVPPDRVRAVVGNCDWPATEPAQEVVCLNGIRILLAHGHQYGVKSTLDRVFYRAQEIGARIAIFGHSHMPVSVDAGGVLLFNPGSLSVPRLPSDPPSCGLIEVSEAGEVTTQHLFA